MSRLAQLDLVEWALAVTFSCGLAGLACSALLPQGHWAFAVINFALFAGVVALLVGAIRHARANPLKK